MFIHVYNQLAWYGSWYTEQETSQRTWVLLFSFRKDTAFTSLGSKLSSTQGVKKSTNRMTALYCLLTSGSNPETRITRSFSPKRWIITCCRTILISKYRNVWAQFLFHNFCYELQNCINYEALKCIYQFSETTQETMLCSSISKKKEGEKLFC